MATAIKVVIGTDGAGVTVTATATPGTTIHTAHATLLDEIWLFAANTGSSDVAITIEFGAAGVNNIEVTIPAESGLVTIVPGIPLTNSKTVAIFAGTTAVIEVFGFVNRITN